VSAIAAAVKSEAASRGVQLHPAGGARSPRILAKSLASSSAWSLQFAPTTMTMTNQTFETLSVDQLAPVTGGGIGSMIGGLFGAKGQQWGALADNILGMFGGLGGLGGLGGAGGAGDADALLRALTTLDPVLAAATERLVQLVLSFRSSTIQAVAMLPVIQ
jgi:hypothetical protein